MAFTEIEYKQVSNLMDNFIARIRPPENIRAQLDVGWRMERQSVFVFEIRPNPRDPEISQHVDFAKATWNKSSKEWHVFWLRANGKWNRYQPLESVVNLQRFVIELENDPTGCFRG